MQILSIHLKNIKSHRDTELSFSAGINVLSGPNGAGKSTIFEAIGYALFGVDARDFVSNVDRFISIGAKKGEVSVTFQTDNGETWRVSRTVGVGSKWLLAKDIGGSFEVEDHAGIEETEARIAELLGLDNGRSLAEQFKLVIGPFQNDFLGPFVIKQSTKRQEAFDEILGIDAWRKTYKGTTGLLKAVEEKIKVLTGRVEEQQKQIVVLPDKQVELATLIASVELKHSELLTKKAAMQQADEKLKKFDQQKVKLDAINNELKQVETSITSGKEHITSQKTLVEQAAVATDVVTQSKAGKERYETAEARLKELRGKEKEKRLLERDQVGLDKEKSGVAQTISHEVRELNELTLSVKDGEKELVGADQELQSQRVSLQEKEQNQQEAATRITELQSNFRNLPVHQVEAVIPTLNMVLQRQQTIADDLALKLESLKGEAAALVAAKQLPELKKELEQLQGERSKLGGRRDNLLEGRDKLGEGICPFFQEPCQNVAGQPSRDVFTSKLDALDGDIGKLHELINEVSTKVGAAEQADKEVVIYAGIATELRRLEREQKENDAEEKKLLQRVNPAAVQKTLAEWLDTAKLLGSVDVNLNALAIILSGTPAERLSLLNGWWHRCHEIIVALDAELTRLTRESEEPLQKTRLELAGLKAQEDHLKTRRTELTDKHTRMVEREKNIADLNKRLKEVNLEHQARQEKLHEFTGLENLITQTEEELAGCKEDRDRYMGSVQAAEELEKRKKKLDDFLNRLKALENERTDKSNALEELSADFSSDIHIQVKVELDSLRIAVATVEQELKGLANNRQRVEGEIELLLRVKTEIESKLADIEEFKEKEALVKFLRNQVFKNVSSQLSERFREEISLRADRIYRTIADSDEELYWGDNYQIVLKDMVDGTMRERSDDQLSGGQTMSAVVALRLALLQTIGARVAFFDEPTSNLDASRRENLAHAFRAIDVGREEVTEHWYDQLFLVSHDVSFTEITDQIIQLGES